MLLDKLTKLIDHCQRVQVALVLSLSPRKQTMTTEDDSVAPGVVIDGVAQHHREFKSGALPRHPNQFMVESPIELFHLALAVCSCSERNSPIGMEVIHMSEGQESVQRSIDGCRDGVLSECA